MPGGPRLAEDLFQRHLRPGVNSDERSPQQPRDETHDDQEQEQNVYGRQKHRAQQQDVQSQRYESGHRDQVRDDGADRIRPFAGGRLGHREFRHQQTQRLQFAEDGD